MANPSIYAAIERLWHHVQIALAGKSDTDHTHDDLYYTESEIDSMLSQKAQVQMITWEAND